MTFSFTKSTPHCITGKNENSSHDVTFVMEQEEEYTVVYYIGLSMIEF